MLTILKVKGNELPALCHVGNKGIKSIGRDSECSSRPPEGRSSFRQHKGIGAEPD